MKLRDILGTYDKSHYNPTKSNLPIAKYVLRKNTMSEYWYKQSEDSDFPVQLQRFLNMLPYSKHLRNCLLVASGMSVHIAAV